MTPGGGAPFGPLLVSIQQTALSDCEKAVSFLQSDFWGRFKARFGWKPLAYKLVWKGGETNTLLVLCRTLVNVRFRFFRLSLAYIPLGPQLPASCPAREAALEELALALKKELPPDTTFIRFDPPWLTDGAEAAAAPFPFIRSAADIQPPDTVLLDLKQSMESIIEQMKPKWRYNARLALKKGVMIREAEAGDTKDMEVFYALLKETSRRDGIAVHNIAYYKALFEERFFSASNSPVTVKLYLAEHEGDVIAGIITLFRAPEAVYLYGASSNKKRNLMATYALQLKAIEDAKASGCEKYDLFGIPPNDDPAHPMTGLYRFKTGFGGEIIHRPGSWDFPCRPVVYFLFRKAESLRKEIRTLKKRFLGSIKKDAREKLNYF